MTETPSQRNTVTLARQTIKGIAWLLGSRAWYQFIHFLVSIILARLLLPDDFGLLGMALVFTNFLNTLSDFGLTSAIVQQKDVSDQQLSSIFWFDMLIGLLCAILLIVISPLISIFYKESRIIQILSFLSLNFILLNGNIVPYALAQKALEYGKITRINALAVFISGLIAILAAYLGLGVWALVLQSLSSSLLILILFWFRSTFIPSLNFHLGDLKDIWKYSLNLMGFSVTNYFSRNADYMIIGHYLGSTSLGFYTLAYNLMLFPITNLVGVINQAVFPALAKIQDSPETVAHAYIKSCQYLGFFTIPAMTGLAIFSKEAILTIYGIKWLESASVLSLLCLVALFQPFTSLVGVLFLARGFTKWLFRWSLVITPIMIVSFLAGIKWGIEGVAAGYLIAQFLVLIFGMPFMYRKVGVSIKQLLEALKIPAISAIIMGIAVYGIRQWLVNISVYSPMIILVIGALAGVLIYSFLLYLFRKYFWKDIKSDLVNIIPAKVSNG